jgi:ketosteroid isomerase-like protein
MQETENTKIVQEGYALFGKGDIVNLLKLYSANIDWEIPGPVDMIPYAGSFRGHPQVQQFFNRLNEAINFEQFEPREYIAQGDNVAVLGSSRARVKSTGQVVENKWMHLLTLQDGKVTRFQAFEDTAAIVAGFNPPMARSR